MKLLFKKDDQAEISVLQTIDGVESEFNYIDMIKSLIATGQIEEPDISEGFSEPEKASINRMIKFINAKALALAEETPVTTLE